MQIQDVTPVGVTAAGGFGNGLQGFMAAKAQTQALDLEQRKMALAEGDAGRRNAYLQIAQDELGLAFERQRFAESEAQRKNSQAARLEAGRTAVAKLLGQNAMKAPNGTSAMPPEYAQAIQSAVDSGDPELVQMAGALAHSSQLKKIADHAVAEMVNDNVPGMDGGASIWSQAGSTGFDVDGDGTPDDVSEIPGLFQARLASGVNPKTGKPEHPMAVLSEYRQLRDKLKTHLEMRKVWVEEGAKLQAEYQPIEINAAPQDRAAARVELQKLASGWYEHEYPGDPKVALQVARENYAMRLAGFEPHQDKDGAISYVKPEDKPALQAKDDALDSAKAFAGAMQDVIAAAQKAAGEAPKRAQPKRANVRRMGNSEEDAALYEADMKAADERFAADTKASEETFKSQSAEYDRRYHQKLGEMVARMLPPEFQGQAGRQMFAGVPNYDVVRENFMVKDPRQAGSVETRQNTSKNWAAVPEAERQSVIDTFKSGKKITGFDMNSIPPEVQKEILYALKARKAGPAPAKEHRGSMQ